MNEELLKMVHECDALSDQLENDYVQLHRYLKGDIYDAYRELVQSEQRLLQKIKRNLY